MTSHITVITVNMKHLINTLEKRLHVKQPYCFHSSIS